MTRSSETTRDTGIETGAVGTFGKLASKLIPPLAKGSLTVQLPSGGILQRTGKQPGPDVTVSVHRWRAFSRLALHGDLGFAGSYLDGDWTTPDLVRLFELVMLNEEALLPQRRSAAFGRFLARLRHSARANTRRGSKRNIAAHYDLGNAFYRPWLDKSMTYSSALFHGDESLEQAQQNKIDAVGEMLDIKGGERVLEIGCGWGALAESLIARGSHVTGITLSEEQLAHSQARLAQHVDAGRADIRLQDYRATPDTFDRIVSIEMFEAVGEAYWPTYFDTLKRRLAAGGTAVLQVITIAEERFKRYRSEPDFIQRYIFPGGMLPTRTHMHELAAKAGFRVAKELPFGESYARTLAEWRKRFRATWPSIEPLGFDDRFRRMWDYYLAYCEVGFRTGATNVILFQLKA